MPKMSEIVPFPNAEETLARLAALRRTKLPLPKNHNFSRADVVRAFTSAFELIGGTTRLALWADENPTEFYRLFGKLLPASSIHEIFSRRDPNDIKTFSTEELEAVLAAELSEDSGHGGAEIEGECERVHASA